MPLLSVVVPIYEVEAYLAECLDSVLAQGVEDFEAILVDDGSTDASGAIAAAYAERDARFRVVSQENHGLGHARNTGVAHARGEFLAFLDSDDAVPPGAYARLMRRLERSGADFATGNVHRFNSRSQWPAAFLARAFMVDRKRTHVSRFRWLLSDRMAQNKLWRRAFWEEHSLRFPHRVLHEDIPVVLRAHVLARSVDVVKAPVYLYREREDGARSITQRRAEVESLEARYRACEQVSALMGAHGERLKRWYDESVVEDDLRYHIDVLGQAGPAYHERFLEHATAFLAQAHPGVEDRLPAIQRLKWALIRERRLADLLEVVCFEQGGGTARKVRRGLRAYGDYPFADALPRRLCRLDTTARRARHVGALVRPYVTPHGPTRAPRRVALPAAPRVSA